MSLKLNSARPKQIRIYKNFYLAAENFLVQNLAKVLGNKVKGHFNSLCISMVANLFKSFFKKGLFLAISHSLETLSLILSNHELNLRKSSRQYWRLIVNPTVEDAKLFVFFE